MKVWHNCNSKSRDTGYVDYNERVNKRRRYNTLLVGTCGNFDVFPVLYQSLLIRGNLIISFSQSTGEWFPSVIISSTTGDQWNYNAILSLIVCI